MKAWWLVAAFALSEVASAQQDPLDLSAIAQARGQVYDAVQAGDFFRGVAPKTDYQVLLDDSKCYWFSGTSEGLNKLDLQLWPPRAGFFTSRVADAKSAGQVMMAHCPTRSGVHRLQVQTEGKGRYTVALFATPKYMGPKYVDAKRRGTLPLGQVVSGSTAGWDWRTGPGGDVWTFVAPRVASYRFHVQSSDHRPALIVFPEHDVSLSHDFRVRRSEFGEIGKDASLSLPLLPGAYEVTVDVEATEQGAYRLWVEEDRSKQAAVRAEDPDVVSPLCAAAAKLGDGVTPGTFQSLPGGMRATCGGTGGDTVYRIAVTRASTVRLHAAAQFRFALELRAGCASDGKPIACVASRGDEGTLTATVAPGEYFVVLDSTEIDTTGGGLPGADIRGAFSLEREPAP